MKFLEYPIRHQIYLQRLPYLRACDTYFKGPYYLAWMSKRKVEYNVSTLKWFLLQDLTPLTTVFPFEDRWKDLPTTTWLVREITWKARWKYLRHFVLQYLRNDQNDLQSFELWGSLGRNCQSGRKLLLPPPYHQYKRSFGQNFQVYGLWAVSEYIKVSNSKMKRSYTICGFGKYLSWIWLIH